MCVSFTERISSQFCRFQQFLHTALSYKVDNVAWTQKVEVLSMKCKFCHNLGSGGADVAKTLRALNKKLRQLEELKGKAPESLTTAQREKLSQEVALRAEIKGLEASQ